jgi:hypothetical protein
MAELETAKAITSLSAIKESEYKQSLISLCQMALTRQN